MTIPWIVSVDDHVVEPPDLWSSRLPAKYRDIGPHVEYHPTGQPVLDGGGLPRGARHRRAADRLVVLRGPPVLGEAPHRRRRLPGRGDRHATASPTTRCVRAAGNRSTAFDDMTMNHVEASLCFPNYPRFCGQLFLEAKDKELARLCVEAYNDWMVEEWCGGSNGRLIPLCLVPLWDADARRRRGATQRRPWCQGGRVLASCPAWLGLPSIHSGYWEPFFIACAETGTVVCMHIGSGTKVPSPRPTPPTRCRPRTSSPTAPCR